MRKANDSKMDASTAISTDFVGSGKCLVKLLELGREYI